MTILTSAIEVNGITHHIAVSSAIGNAGGCYTVLVDKYCAGSIVRYTKYDADHKPLYTYWQPFINYGEVLTVDDIDAIVDLIEALDG